ncbi:glutamate ligase domain-containing protein [Streptomyces sp. NPDC096136]|uniref:glutamate ligase domain-containing protein n=1 Tax=Streptomyces sp. NPDC096136 TaxID=3366076 RepID=UPI00381944F9
MRQRIGSARARPKRVRAGGRRWSTRAGCACRGWSSPGCPAMPSSLAAYAAGRVLGEARRCWRPGCRLRRVRRRVQVLAEAAGARVVDSFAHHPTVIAADIAAGRELTGSRVVVAFEPGRAARVQVLGTRMGAALAAANEVVLPVRDAVSTAAGGVSATRASGKPQSPPWSASTRPGLGEAVGVLAGLVRTGDVVPTMVAGEVAGLGTLLLEASARPLTAL